MYASALGRRGCLGVIGQQLTTSQESGKTARSARANSGVLSADPAGDRHQVGGFGQDFGNGRPAAAIEDG